MTTIDFVDSFAVTEEWLRNGGLQQIGQSCQARHARPDTSDQRCILDVVYVALLPCAAVFRAEGAEANTACTSCMHVRMAIPGIAGAIAHSRQV